MLGKAKTMVTTNDQCPGGQCGMVNRQYLCIKDKNSLAVTNLFTALYGPNLCMALVRH